MEEIGLEPRFVANLSVKDLVTHAGLALLHVDEPVPGTTIRHAVALLDVDPVRRVVVIGNPLSGRQTVSFDQMEGYWIGEAILVERRP